MTYTVKVERFHNLKDLYQNFDMEEDALKFMEYLKDCIIDDIPVEMSFKYRGDTHKDTVEETHVFRAELIKAVQMVVTYRED